MAVTCQIRHERSGKRQVKKNDRPKPKERRETVFLSRGG